MTVESAGLDYVRGPFDYAIAEKSALLEALASDGRSLQHEPATSGTYTMPIEGRQGVHSNGVYYWHDYPKADRLTLHPDWADHTPVVNEKYDYLWQRFARSVTEPGEKIFVISSTQHNLPQFAADEAAFARSFGIDGAFLAAVQTALHTLGARDFSILAMLSSFDEVDSLRAAALDGVAVRYCGRLLLKPNEDVSRLIRDVGVNTDHELLDALVGSYGDGISIARQAPDAVRVFRDKDGARRPWGEAYVSGTEYLFALEDRYTAVLRATLTGDRLDFANGSAWTTA